MISIQGSCLLVLGITVTVRLIVPAIRKLVRFLYLLSHVPTAPHFLPIFGHTLLGLKVSIENRCSFPTALHILGQRLLKEPDFIPGHDEVGCFKFWVFFYPVVVICAPETAANLFASKTLPKSVWMQRYILYGLLTVVGDVHKYHRKLLSPYFDINLFRRLAPIVHRNGDRFCQIISKKIKKEDGFVQSINSLMAMFAVPALLESAMGMTGDQVHKTFSESKIREMASLVKFLFLAQMKRVFYFMIPDFIYHKTPDGKKLVQRSEDYTQFTQEMIAKHKDWRTDANSDPDANNKGNKTDVTSLMDILVREHEKNPDVFTQKDLYGEFKTFFAGGIETYITTITWLFHYVGNHPEVQERMRQEVDSIFGSSDREGTLDDFQQMKYTEAVIKETLRIQSSVPGISRTLDKEYVLNTRSGKTITLPASTEIIMYLWFMHRDPFHWPDPESFDPERFLTGSPKSLKQGFVAFSSGHRNCIGQKYAMTIMIAFLSLIVRRFTFKCLDPIGSLTGIPTLGLVPDKDVRIQFSPRDPLTSLSDPCHVL